MAAYLVNQLRGWAGPMQDPRCVPGEMEKNGKTAYGLAHNLGLGELHLRQYTIKHRLTCIRQLSEQAEVA